MIVYRDICDDDNGRISLFPEMLDCPGTFEYI